MSTHHAPLARLAHQLGLCGCRPEVSTASDLTEVMASHTTAVETGIGQTGLGRHPEEITTAIDGRDMAFCANPVTSLRPLGAVLGVTTMGRAVTVPAPVKTRRYVQPVFYSDTAVTAWHSPVVRLG
jgi:hypothetical protein